MPNPTWPTDVPDCWIINGYVEEKQPVIIRSPVDSGPQKVRRRYTKALIGVMASIVCDVAELDKLNTFFDVTLQGGSLPFDYDNKPTEPGINYTYRFLQPPRFSSVTDTHFTVELVFEQID